jgi:transposase
MMTTLAFRRLVQEAAKRQTCKQIGDRLGISETTVSRWKTQLRPTIPATPEQIEQLRAIAAAPLIERPRDARREAIMEQVKEAMAATGKDAKAAATITGLSVPSVYRYYRLYG